MCTKWMENCEAMTSSLHSFAYSYRLVKKCFLKICETSKCHNFLIFQPIFIRFSLLCLKMFTLSSEIKLSLLWSSSLKTKTKHAIARSNLASSFFGRCWSERSSRRMSRRLLEDTWKPWIFILLCPYVTFVIIMSLLHHIAKFALDMRVSF